MGDVVHDQALLDRLSVVVCFFVDAGFGCVGQDVHVVSQFPRLAGIIFLVRAGSLVVRALD